MTTSKEKICPGKSRNYNEKCAIINDLSQHIILFSHVAEISNAIFDTLEKILEFARVDLFLLDEITQSLHLSASRGPQKPEMDTMIPLAEESEIITHVARTGKPLNIPDIQNNEVVLHGRKGIQSELDVPLTVKDKLIGVLHVESGDPHAFSEDDQRLLETLAPYAAPAFDNARHYEELEKVTVMYRTLIDISPVAIMVTDLEGYITYVSSKTLELHDYEHVDELIGKSAFDLIAPEDRERAGEHLQKILMNGSIREIEYTLLKKDGSRFAGELNASLIKDSSGKPVSLIATSRDLTELKEAKDTVSSSEATFKGLFENVLEGIYQTSPHGKILAANPALIAMLGYESEQEFYELDIIHDLYVDPDQRKTVIDEMEREGAIKDVELVLKRKDGRHITVLESGRTVYNRMGEILYYEGILTDITERKRAEKQLENLFKASRLLNSSISMEKIFKYISDSIQELVEFDNFIIFLVSKDRKNVYPAYITHGLRQQFKDIVLEYGEGLVGHCIDTQEILLLDNADTDERGIWVPGSEVCVSQILVPLIVEGKCVGALHISKSIENAYTHQDVDILEPLSEIISTAIRNSRLFEEVKEFGRVLEKRIDERSKKIEVLIQTRQELQRERNWERGLHTIIQSMSNLGFERCGVALVNSHQNTLEFQFGKGIDLPKKDTSLSLKNSHYFGVKCVHEKRTIHVKDFKPKEGKQITSDSHSFVWVPIIVQDEAFAALAADNIESSRPITSEDVKDLEILAGMCASFIDRTRISIEPLVENNLETGSRFELKPSEGYIILEIKPDKSIDIFVDLVTHGIPGFIITREYPEKIVDRYNLVKTPIVWLSQSEKQNSVSPNDLSKLTYIVQEFVRKSEESVILLDGIEYLVAETGFLPVLKFLHSLKDITVIGNSRLILPVFRDTLPLNEFSMLLKEFIVLNTDDSGTLSSHI